MRPIYEHVTQGEIAFASSVDHPPRGQPNHDAVGILSAEVIEDERLRPARRQWAYWSPLAIDLYISSARRRGGRVHHRYARGMRHHQEQQRSCGQTHDQPRRSERELGQPGRELAKSFLGDPPVSPARPLMLAAVGMGTAQRPDLLRL